MILDILVVLIFVLLAVYGYKKGASYTLVSLFGMFVCLILAATLADIVSTVFYDTFISEKVFLGVSQYVSDSKTVILSQTVDSYPSFVRFLVEITGYSDSEALSISVENVSDKVAIAAEIAIKPLVVSVISIGFTLIFFILFYILFRVFLTKPLTAVFKLPLINTLDSVCGVVLSFGTSYLLVSFIAFILRLLIPVCDNMPIFFNESTIYNSYIFYYLYSGNIFYNIISLF